MSDIERPEPKVAELLDAVTKAKGTNDILRSLEPAMSVYRLENIRYYRYSPTKGTLTSQDAVIRTNPRLEEALKLGAIVSSTDETTNDQDTFCCFRLQQPVVFKLNPDQASAFECVIRDSGPVLINLKKHSCPSSHFDRHKDTRRKWVDFPLYISETPVGKFSCDLTADGEDLCERNPTDSGRIIRNFFALCQYVAPFLEFWISHDLSTPLNIASNELHALMTAPELFEYCTSRLRQHEFFNCDYADLFLAETSVSGKKRLVLKRTSNKAMRGDINKKFYDLPSMDEKSGALGDDLRADENSELVKVSLTVWSAISKERRDTRTFAAMNFEYVSSSSIATFPMERYIRQRGKTKHRSWACREA